MTGLTTYSLTCASVGDIACATHRLRKKTALLPWRRLANKPKSISIPLRAINNVPTSVLFIFLEVAAPPTNHLIHLRLCFFLNPLSTTLVQSISISMQYLYNKNMSSMRVGLENAQSINQDPKRYQAIFSGAKWQHLSSYRTSSSHPTAASPRKVI